MFRNIIATRHDGRRTHTIVYTFDVPDANFDLEAAIKSAATDYAKTEDGMELYEHNHNEINYGDFSMYVPNEFCEKHGFKKVDTELLPDIHVNFDEDLVDEDQLYSEDDDESEED